MHRITLTIILLLSATAADAGWYHKTDGTLVDPIMDIYGSVHSYPHWLRPHFPYPDGTDLSYAELPEIVLNHSELELSDLSGANLTNAKLYFSSFSHTDLSGANLSGATLQGADLWGANLIGANLTDANLSNAFLGGAYLTGASLSGADFSDAVDFFSANFVDAFYYTDNEPTWHSAMDAAWRSSRGILALAPVPEPAAILLALIGLPLVPRRRRR